jgi:TonB family protein
MHLAAAALIVYSTQILLVVSVATLAAIVLWRQSAPAVRLAYWRAVGFVCLALPLLALPRAGHPALSVSFVAAMSTEAAIIGTAPVAAPANTAILWIWAIGVLGHIARLLAGAWRLRQLRRTSTLATVSGEIDALRVSLAARARFCWSRELEQPVTFGIRRPVVLLPERFGELSTEAQSAVARHELLHVARRDWLWIVLEEHVRALFWFHPAVWWLVEQMQLAREHVIDRLVVSSAVSKRTYMNALLAFADRGAASPLSIGFLRQRHLKSRFQELSKEPRMSLRQVAWTTAVLAIVMGGTAIGAARALPLDLGALAGQAQFAARLEIKLAETAPGAGLKAASVPGANQRVYLHQTTLATDADVTSASVVDLGGHFGIGVRFSDQASARMRTGTSAHLGKPVAIVLNGEVVSAPTVRAPIGDSAVITGNFTAAAAQELANKLAPVRPRQNGSIRDGVTLPILVYEERPQYVPAAMEAKVQGSVLLEAVVLTDGSVGDVTVVRSLDPTYGLDQQAVDAMKRWSFQPGTRDGEPVRVVVQVEMRFTLK